MTYSKPQAQVVNLYGEDIMLAGSGKASFDVDKTKETNNEETIYSSRKHFNLLS